MCSNFDSLCDRSGASACLHTAFVLSSFFPPVSYVRSGSLQPLRKPLPSFSTQRRLPSARGAPLLPSINMTSCQTPDTSASDTNISSDDNSPSLGFDDCHTNPEQISSLPHRPALTSRPHAPRLKKVVRGALLIAGIGVLATFVRPAASYVSGALSVLSQRAVQFGPLRAAALLAVINFFTVVFCFPANMGLMIAAGAVLPAPYAFSALFCSKIAAAAAAFLLSRTLLLSRVKRALDKYPRFRSILARSGTDGGWRFVLLMRLSPFPGFVLNYLFSLTGVTFVQYIIGSVIGIVPSIANLVLIGNTARNVSMGVAADGTIVSWLPIILKLLGVGSMIATTVYVSKAVSRTFGASDLDMPSSDIENGLYGNGSSHFGTSTPVVDKHESKYVPLQSQE